MGSKSQQQVQVAPSATSAFLAVMYIAAFVAAFNENIINVALHDIMAAFSVSAITAQWLVSGYMIVTSIFTAIMAFLSGRFSTRKLLFFACGCLVAGEVLCLVAPTFTVLLPSRILQAAGSGILFPLMMNVVLSCAPREKLGLYLSLGGACITLGPAFGPVISGLMCTLFGWRAVFVVPLVGGVVVAAAAAKLVRNVGERSNTTLDISVGFFACGRHHGVCIFRWRVLDQCVGRYRDASRRRCAARPLYGPSAQAREPGAQRAPHGERSFLACVHARGGVDDDDVLDERFAAALF